MMFMNEWEIEENVARHRRHPALGPATQFLYAFMREVNSHSDGWPYWSPPVHSAKALMILIERGNKRARSSWPEEVEDVTLAEVQTALRPIKSFMTRRGYAAGMKLPALQLTLPNV